MTKIWKEYEEPWLGLKNLVCVENKGAFDFIFKICEARDSRVLYPKGRNLGYKIVATSIG